jgi:DHA2 family multidrug resistance protein
MPLVGVLSSRVDLRYLIGFGLGMQVIAFWYMGHLSTQMAFENAAFARLLQAAGLPFLFIPITTIAYVGLKPEENNQASALMNVMRNLGGTIGISTVQTLLARGEQIHQSRLVENLNPLNPNYVQATSRAAQALGGQGASASGATLGNLYQSVQQQAAMLSYVDVFYLLMIVVICTLPLLLVMEKGRASGTMEGGA